jgi:hypothetical protein
MEEFMIELLKTSVLLVESEADFIAQMQVSSVDLKP